jgi:hypothetical protein
MVNDLKNWLPDDCCVNLTQLELGALFAILHAARRHGLGSAIVNKPGPYGEPVAISIISRLIEKVELSIAERKSRPSGQVADRPSGQAACPSGQENEKP